MELILDGEVKELALKYHGNYSFANEPDPVNGYPYWYKQDDNLAIWLTYYHNWNVGNLQFIGQLRGKIISPYYVRVWPTQILDGYLYHNPKSGWMSASSKEVIFKDRKYLFPNTGNLCKKAFEISCNFKILKY